MARRVLYFLYFLCFLFFLLICGVFASPGFSAQSSADVTVSDELKDAARQQLLAGRGATVERLEPYVIGHGDILHVSIYGEGDMAASSLGGVARAGEKQDAPRDVASGVMVMMDGRISLKHVGDVEVVGLNLTELADYLKQLYQAVFEDPIVTTTLVQSNSLRYTVMGKVNSPGIFFLDFPLTAVQVIARSGGFTEWANKKMTIVRQDLQDADRHLFTDHTLEFDYDAFVSGDKLDRNIAIRSGDIIIVH